MCKKGGGEEGAGEMGVEGVVNKNNFVLRTCPVIFFYVCVCFTEALNDCFKTGIL